MYAIRHYILVASLLAPAAASAQLGELRITEVMFNPSASSEAKFEWVEVQNTGEAAIDLDGYIFGDMQAFLPITETPLDPVNLRGTASGGLASNTIVPAGGLAVLYNGTAFDYDDSRFRAGWNLGAGVPLIAVDTTYFPTLNNSGNGRQLGFWKQLADWQLDAPEIDTNNPPDGVNDRRAVSGFSSAAYSFDYTIASGFPSGNASADQGKSIAWNGMGEASDPANWTLSEAGVNGASASVATFLSGGERRNGLDLASPGTVPTGAAASGLLVTEVMVDPAAGDNGNSNVANSELEWIEIYNNTGSDIDFSLGGYVLDDFDGMVNTAPNIADGFLGSGEVAVLFDGEALSPADMATMWGAGNYVAVSNFPALANGGETFGIWDSLDDYQRDAATGSFDSTVAALTYANSGDWPDTGDPGSIYLTDLQASDGNGLAASGLRWGKSIEGFDGVKIAGALGTSMTPDYVAGDIGSPGRIGAEVSEAVPGDFNGDRVVDLADYVVWRDNLGSTAVGVLHGNGDGSGSSAGIVDHGDYVLWKNSFASRAGAAVTNASVPEPATRAVVCLATVAGLQLTRRRRAAATANAALMADASTNNSPLSPCGSATQVQRLVRPCA